MIGCKNVNELTFQNLSDEAFSEESQSNLSYNCTGMKILQKNYSKVQWNLSEIYMNLNNWNITEKIQTNPYSVNFSINNNQSSVYAKFYNLYPTDQWELHKFYSEEYMKLANVHWFDFPPPSPIMHYLLAALYFLLMLIGLLGNGLVIYMILSFRSLRTPSNILILNLAMSDFLMMSKTPVFIYNSVHFGPVLGDLGCQLYGFMGGMTGTASIMTLAAIALDRYLVIANPLNNHHRPTKHKIIGWIILIWIYSAAFASIPLANFGVKRYVPEGYLTSCSFDYLSTDTNNRCFIFVYFLAAWCLPLLIIITSYVGICREVLRVGLIRKGQEKEKRQRELKLTIVVALVIVMWFVSWTPYAVVALLGISGYSDYVTPLGSMIPAVFCKTAAVINPFIYALNHPRLRQEILKLLCRDRYNFERTQFTIKSNRSIGSRASCNYKLKEEILSNKRKVFRRASHSSQLSVKSIQLEELNSTKVMIN